MHFDDFSAVLAMEGHGIYVWPAYLITLTVIVVILLVPLRRHRRILALRAQELRREQRLEEQQPGNLQQGQNHQEAN